MWKDTINYAVRCILVGDEEETRIPDDKNGYMEGFREEGVGEEDLELLDTLIKAEEYDLNYDLILKILMPYISHKELFVNHRAYWMWRAINPPHNYVWLPSLDGSGEVLLEILDRRGVPFLFIGKGTGKGGWGLVTIKLTEDWIEELDALNGYAKELYYNAKEKQE